jgi:hypothetical protein
MSNMICGIFTLKSRRGTFSVGIPLYPFRFFVASGGLKLRQVSAVRASSSPESF